MFPDSLKQNRTLKFFMKNSSLHGMKYIGDEKKHWCIRVCWCILLVVFAVIAVQTLTDRWIMWKESPTIITTVNSATPISSLPVPAITYCRDLNIPTEATNFEHLTEEDQIILCRVLEITTVKLTTEICDDLLRKSWNRYDLVWKIDSDTFFNILNRLEITGEKYLNNKTTSFMPGQRFDEPITCYDTPTHLGLCITCNALPLSQIYNNNTILHYYHNNPEDYAVAGQINGFPRLNSSKFQQLYPSLVKRPMNGLNLNNSRALESRTDESSEPVNRWYTIHSPWDVPSPFMRWHYSQQLRNRELQVFIEPDQLLIDDNLQLSPLIRQCYLPYEKPLDFFKYYTHQNCKLDCATTRVLKDCGCVMFYMPHNDSTKICITDDHCQRRIIEEIIRNGSLACDCLSSCNHTDYKFVSHDSIRNRGSSKLITVFIDDRFYPRLRGESNNIVNFIENSVTYLDMFLGLSLITVVEILYYSILMLLECFNVELLGEEE